MRRQRAIEEITGNESLLGMLETDAAVELLEWGKSMVLLVIDETRNQDNGNADLLLEPRLKAVRQSMRSIGNWAAGKYSDEADQAQLRARLLDNFGMIYGDKSRLPSAEELDAVLELATDKQTTPGQRVVKLRELFRNIG